MITNLTIKNFKSLKEVDLQLSNLNILTGLNGSGKSSIIQTLLLLRQNVSYLAGSKLKLNESRELLFDAGLGEDVYYRQGIEPKISFHLAFNDEVKKKKLLFDFNYIREEHEKYDYLEVLDGFGEEFLKQYSLFNDNFQYLITERESPSDTYPASVENVIKKKTLGLYGEHTAFYLETFGTEKRVKCEALLHPNAKGDSLIFQVDAWLSEISPRVSIDTKLTNRSERVELRYKYGVNSYKPKNVGFGLSYVLPVLVALLTAEKDRLIIIENPESHLHPRGQAELGKLLALATQTEAQIIIETHSDHILNGMRVAVKENPELRNNINIFFHDRVNVENEEYSKIELIKIDKNGELSDYPDNFLDEWSNQLFKLV